MATFQAQVLDVGTGGLGDPQPVQREQRDQRMLGWRPEPGRHQQRRVQAAVCIWAATYLPTVQPIIR